MFDMFLVLVHPASWALPVKSVTAAGCCWFWCLSVGLCGCHRVGSWRATFGFVVLSGERCYATSNACSKLPGPDPALVAAQYTVCTSALNGLVVVRAITLERQEWSDKLLRRSSEVSWLQDRFS